MNLYHGFPKTAEVPQYGFGSKENDYGLGFYCTQSDALAKKWACPTVQKRLLQALSCGTTGEQLHPSGVPAGHFRI